MNKFNLKDTSFVIHFRRDSDDRLYNLRCILKYFHNFIDYGELFIINDDSEQDPELENISNEYPNVSLAFLKNEGVYRRTFCFNKIASIATKRVLCFYDTDTIIKPKYLSRSQDGILSGSIDHIYPYNGIFVDVKKPCREVLANFEFEKLESLLLSRNLGYDNDDLNVVHTSSVGGSSLYLKKHLIKLEDITQNLLGGDAKTLK